MDVRDLTMPALQKAFALQPALASQSASQVMLGTTAAAPKHFASLSPTLNPLSGVKTHSDEELRQVSQKFESIFLQMLFKEMRNSVEKSGLLGNSQATEFFESMHDEQLSEQLSLSGGIGIGNMVYQKLKEATVAHQNTFS